MYLQPEDTQKIRAIATTWFLSNSLRASRDRFLFMFTLMTVIRVVVKKILFFPTKLTLNMHETHLLFTDSLEEEGAWLHKVRDDWVVYSNLKVRNLS